jgi:hypothetical protein
LAASPALQAFIEESLDEATFRSIQARERRLYHQQVTSTWKDARVARQVLLDDDRLQNPSIQLKLGLLDPH